MISGKHIKKLEERDIDLLPPEEFHATEEFTTWFCSLAGVQNPLFERAWHSVADSDGESDIVLSEPILEFHRRCRDHRQNEIGKLRTFNGTEI